MQKRSACHSVRCIIYKVVISTMSEGRATSAENVNMPVQQSVSCLPSSSLMVIIRCRSSVDKVLSSLSRSMSSIKPSSPSPCVLRLPKSPGITTSFCLSATNRSNDVLGAPSLCQDLPVEVFLNDQRVNYSSRAALCAISYMNESDSAFNIPFTPFIYTPLIYTPSLLPLIMAAFL